LFLPGLSQVTGRCSAVVCAWFHRARREYYRRRAGPISYWTAVFDLPNLA
jgi:hypothetical protein